MRKNINAVTLLFSAALFALSFTLINISPTYATVPGVNAGISINTSGNNPDNSSGSPSISQDGRFIAFSSQATDLVSPATSSTQIFLRDRLNNTTSLVSKSSSGVMGNSYSILPRISANGRYVVFESNASNLISSDTNAKLDVFMHDMVTGTTTRVSENSSGVQGNNHSQNPDVNSDGTYVVFDSYASNLVSSLSVSGSNVYEKNTVTGAVRLLSQSSGGVDANADSWQPRISCEGRFITFSSYANNIVSGDTNDSNHSISRIYLVDMLQSNPTPMYLKGDANASSTLGTITCNGNYIAFSSDATNIISGDTNGFTDAFVYDRVANSFERVSVSSSGDQGNSASTDYPTVSNDGKYVVFTSDATNFASGDTNATSDIFLRNRQTGTTELITRNASGTISDKYSSQANISSDGRYVAYMSDADNLVGGLGVSNGLVYASQTGAGYDY